MAKIAKLAIQSVACRASLIAKAQASVTSCKPIDKFAHCISTVGDFAVVTHLSLAASFRQANGYFFFAHIQTNVKCCIIGHGSSPMFEALAAKLTLVANILRREPPCRSGTWGLKIIAGEEASNDGAALFLLMTKALRPSRLKGNSVNRIMFGVTRNCSRARTVITPLETATSPNTRTALSSLWNRMRVVRNIRRGRASGRIASTVSAGATEIVPVFEIPNLASSLHAGSARPGSGNSWNPMTHSRATNTQTNQFSNHPAAAPGKPGRRPRCQRRDHTG